MGPGRRMSDRRALPGGVRPEPVGAGLPRSDESPAGGNAAGVSGCMLAVVPAISQTPSAPLSCCQMQIGLAVAVQIDDAANVPGGGRPGWGSCRTKLVAVAPFMSHAPIRPVLDCCQTRSGFRSPLMSPAPTIFQSLPTTPPD